jgi:hypothetical protein
MPEALEKIPTAMEMWQARDAGVRYSKCFLSSERTISNFDRELCLRLTVDKKNVLIVGDSFAADLYSVMVKAFPNVNFLQATSGNCTPYFGYIGDQNCADILRAMFDEFIPANKLDAVILAGNWTPENGMNAIDTVSKLSANGLRVMLAGPPVRFQKNVPDLIFESKAKNPDQAEEFVLRHRSTVDTVNEIFEKRMVSKSDFIDVAGAMCSPRCRIFSPSDKLMIIDFGHLTVDGASYLSGNLKAMYPNLFR